MNNPPVNSDGPLTNRPGPNRAPLSVALITLGALVAGAGAGVVTEKIHHGRHAQDVIVAVNGTSIRQSQFFERLQQTVGPTVVTQMAQEDLLLQFGAKEHALPSEVDVAALFSEAKQRPGYQNQLTASRGTAGDYREALRLQLIRAKLLTRGTTVSDADVRKFYDANTNPANPNARYYTPAQGAFDVIITSTEQEASQAQFAIASGVPFATAAQKYSKHASAKNGGVITVVKGRSDASKVPGLEKLLFGLKYGEQSTAQPVGGGWVIAKCLDRAPAQVEPFQKVKLDARLNTMLQIGAQTNGAKVAAQLLAFRKTLPVHANWPRYTDVLNRA